MERKDGPFSNHFWPVLFESETTWEALQTAPLSDELRIALHNAPRDLAVGWGIPFEIQNPLLLAEEPVQVALPGVRARWLVFMHTSDARPVPHDDYGLTPATRGVGQLGEVAAHYVIGYADGTDVTVPIRRRFEIGAFQRIWGENCLAAVGDHKPYPLRLEQDQGPPAWGKRQTRAVTPDQSQWMNWLWAWENPHPDKAMAWLRLEPASGSVLVMGLAAGEVSTQPLRWESRKKALLTLPEGTRFQPVVDASGLLSQIRLDMGQVISAQPRPLYPHEEWESSYNNRLPELTENQVLIEYTAHPEATFHLWNGTRVSVAEVQAIETSGPLTPVAPASQRVTLRAIEAAGGKPVPVKLHVHGAAGEYLAPVDRHRIPNPYWFEDYSVDFVHAGQHYCTYIPGETVIDLPLGRVYIEVSKGFEIKPVRVAVEVTPETTEITIPIEKVLPWRELGWVSADTHVHFLSPMSALLEGAAEGVNVVNLLASQWGELMTNVGDFDGRNTWGSKETGGDGEHLVRVGTENRQHVLGHISLLGYEGRIIAPMTTGGPDESALGDPIEFLLTEWARQVHRQGGLAILPHFPNPRAEHAASIVEGEIDGIEMTSWGDLYSGISPYSLSDWYRYLNNGYLVPAVGGTDKMSAGTAVGTVRTYALIPTDRAFTYAEWMEAIRQARTFVTYGPLLDCTVDGQPMGARMQMNASGGTVEFAWEAASVTVPMSRAELVVNGVVRESVAIDPWKASGSWSFKAERSSWLALLIRGHYPDKSEIVAAHSTPVMVELEGSPFYATADAVTILEQIEGSLAYLDTVGTRAEAQAYKRVRLVLESAHRQLHNRMHQQGHYHEHTPGEDHSEHH